MGDESDLGYTITLDSSESLDGGLDFSNTMSDVTYTMDTSTTTNTVSIPGATVGGITGGAYTFDVGTIESFDLNTLDEDEINEMCKEYPALKIVWQNFKTMYDLVKQDYKGKKEAGELDDEIPF